MPPFFVRLCVWSLVTPAPHGVPAEPRPEYDCAVHALRWLSGVTAAEAQVHMEACGWRPELGCNLWQLTVALSAYGRLDLALGYGTGFTPRQFARCHEDGRWLLLVEGHAMPLVDGWLYNGEGYWSQPLTAVLAFTLNPEA